MTEVSHHIAELADFLSVGAVSVFGGCLGMREVDNVKGKLLHDGYYNTRK